MTIQNAYFWQKVWAWFGDMRLYFTGWGKKLNVIFQNQTKERKKWGRSTVDGILMSQSCKSLLKAKWDA